MPGLVPFYKKIEDSLKKVFNRHKDIKNIVIINNIF